MAYYAQDVVLTAPMLSGHGDDIKICGKEKVSDVAENERPWSWCSYAELQTARRATAHAACAATHCNLHSQGSCK
jgi:hypothetical protein